VERYRHLLANRPFARLWGGSTVSAIGDSLTWVALVWLVLERTSSAREVSLLVIFATAPTIVGGLVMGSALDRADRRRFLVMVNTVLGLAVLSVPVAAAAGSVTLPHLFAVAALYGLLKMANWAGVPSMLPTFVADPDDLATANAMESISFGLADIAGPALSGVLIAVIGAAWVLGVDAATYVVFVLALLSLPRITTPPRAVEGRGLGLGLGPAARFIWSDRAIFATTAMFTAFNIGTGMMLVFLPYYALKQLNGTSRTFGLLLSAFAVAATAGAVVVGGMRWRLPIGRSIAGAQTLAGLSFVPMLALPAFIPTMCVLAVAGLFASPLTIWAQTLRMQRIPEEMRGRVFGMLRTVMQSTTPIGGAIAGILISTQGLRLTLWVVIAVTALPGAIGLVVPALSPANAPANADVTRAASLESSNE
jgi:MFS family permease